jgi:glycosyltransferase involved in cell wall biosynthesis
MGIVVRLARAVYTRGTFRTHAISKAQGRLDALAARGCRFLICIPYLKSGGAERVAANLAHAFSNLYGPESVAVLVTDWSGLMVRLIFSENVFNNYPRGVEIVDITAMSHASFDERVWELMTATISMRPEMVININSHLMWECWERFAPELSRHTRLGTVAFLHMADKRGRPIGYTETHLERLLPFLNFVISDNESYMTELKRTLASAPITEKVADSIEWAAAKLLTRGLDVTQRTGQDLAHYVTAHKPTEAEWTTAKLLAKQIPATTLDQHDAAKFRCLYQYTTTGKARSPFPRVNNKRPQILWASRVTRSKFPELLPRIARLLPQCDIHAYGAREFGYRFPRAKRLLLPQYDLGDRISKAPNLFWHGGYRSFDSIGPEQFEALVYTSLYDGLPNVLLEAGAHGIPIVAPISVGGIGELISEQTGWPVLNPYDAREYADRIRDVLSSSRDAMKRSDALGRLIAARHSFEGFCTDVRKFVEDAPHLTSIAAE